MQQKDNCSLFALEYITGIFQAIGWGGLFLIFVISIVISTIKDYLKRRKEMKK